MIDPLSVMTLFSPKYKWKDILIHIIYVHIIIIIIYKYKYKFYKINLKNKTLY